MCPCCGDQVFSGARSDATGDQAITNVAIGSLLGALTTMMGLICGDQVIPGAHLDWHI